MAANKDDINEASQALFCALADFTGSAYANKQDSVFNVKNFTTYQSFKLEWDKKFKDNSIENIFKDRVKADKVTFNDVDNNLSSNSDWYVSSVLIAKKLILDIDDISSSFSKIKKPKWSQIFYHHKDTLMEDINTLFTESNDKQKNIKDSKVKKNFIPFGDINKWNPADIYFASNKAEKKINSLTTGSKLNQMNFIQLNTVVSDLIDEGELLPLSLKKETSQVSIKKVNFDKTKEWKELAKINMGSYKWTKFPTGSMPAKPPPRDIKIYLTDTNSDRDNILLRHDSSKASFKGEIYLKGMEARGGSLGLEQLLAIIGLIKEDVPQKIQSKFDAGNKKFKSLKKPIREEYEKALKKAGLNIRSNNPKEKEKIKQIRKNMQYDEKVGRLSAICVTNEIIPILISEILDDKNAAQSFVKYAYAYAASQSLDSCKFVIAK